LFNNETENIMSNRSFTMSMVTGEEIPSHDDEPATLEAPGAREDGVHSRFDERRFGVVDGRDFRDTAPQLMERFYGHPSGYRGFDGNGAPNGGLLSMLELGRRQSEPPCVYVGGDVDCVAEQLLN